MIAANRGLGAFATPPVDETIAAFTGFEFSWLKDREIAFVIRASSLAEAQAQHEALIVSGAINLDHQHTIQYSITCHEPAPPSPPKTLEGIKRLAKRIKREQAIPHHLALDQAARGSGYENFRHAQNELRNS